MRNLMYFNPDPAIPDADLLGYGDLIYDDGSAEYLSGDPEMAGSLPGLPPGMSPKGSQVGPPPAPVQMGPPPPPVPIEGPGGQQFQLDMTGNLAPASDPLDYRSQQPEQGQVSPLSFNAGEPPVFDPNADPLAPQAPPSLGGGAPGGSGGVQPPPPVSFTADNGQAYTIDPTGNIQPGSSGVPVEQLQQQRQGGGMVPVQREGALPPEMAQRQLGELGAAQQNTIQATADAQRQQYQLYNELTLKQMAANEAERVKREQDIADQQAKAERWQGEQQQLLNQGIENDLVSARGPVGGVFAAIGAALLGAAGNDTGFRMIERQIDQHVRNQVQVRDTKLGLLSQQLGSAQQAIAMGKAALYKVAADRTELLAQKTKNDVFEAQSPAIIAGLKQKAVEELQKAEQLSIGKTLEKVPLPPKPPSDEMLQKYGALRRDRDGSASIAQRAEQEIGLVWAPGQNGQPGHYANKADVLKQGIQGVGNLEQWIPDLVYSTMGGMTKEGYQVRGAAEAMAYAQIRQMQPTGPISNADIQAAVKAGALNTEEGLVQGLERIRNANEMQERNDAAQFGPDVVSEYNRRYQASGGQGLTAQPTPTRPATADEMRGAAQGMRQPPQAPAERGPGNLPPPTPEEFRASVQGFAEGANLNPDAIMRVIGHESGGKPGVTNKLTGKHAGLIQFSQETWQGLAREAGTPNLSWEEMRKMTAEEQLPYVMMYYNRLGLGPDNTPGDYAMATFMPAFWKKPDDFVLGLKDSSAKIAGLSMGKIYAQNPGLQNGDKITVGDVRRSVGG